MDTHNLNEVDSTWETSSATHESAFETLPQLSYSPMNDFPKSKHDEFGVSTNFTAESEHHFKPEATEHPEYGTLSRKQRVWSGILILISALPGVIAVASDPVGVYTPMFAVLALQLLAAAFAFARPRISLSLLVSSIPLQLLCLLWGGAGHIYSNGAGWNLTVGFLVVEFGLPIAAFIIMFRGTAPVFGSLRFDSSLKIAFVLSFAWAALTMGPALAVHFDATASGAVNKHVKGDLICCAPWSHLIHAPDPLLLWIGVLLGPTLILMSALRNGGRARTTAWVGSSVYMVGVSLFPISQIGGGDFFKHTNLGGSSIDLTMTTSVSTWGWGSLLLASAALVYSAGLALRSRDVLEIAAPYSGDSEVGTAVSCSSSNATFGSQTTSMERLAALNGVVLVEICNYSKAARARDRRRGSLEVQGDSIAYVRSTSTIAKWPIHEINEFRSRELPSGRVEILFRTPDAANVVFTTSDSGGIAFQVCNELALDIIPNLNQP